MELTISWTNRTPEADSIKLYRKEEPFLESAMGEPIATLAGNTSSFIDDVEFGKTYYYRTQTLKGGDSVTSSQLKVIATTYTGPGPQELISGDTECGFYGEVTEQELDNPGLLMTRVLGVAAPYGASTNWLKFSYKGKILYISKQMITPTSYKALYDAKLIDGKRGLPRYPLAHATTLEQYREEVIRGQRFIVRTIEGDNAAKRGYLATGSSVNVTDNVAGFRDCEFTDLIMAVINSAAIVIPKRKLASYAGSEINSYYLYFEYMQECFTYPLLRGALASPNSAYMGSGYVITANQSSYQLIAGGSNNYVYGTWRPVLEWIGPAT